MFCLLKLYFKNTYNFYGEQLTVVQKHLNDASHCYYCIMTHIFTFNAIVILSMKK